MQLFCSKRVFLAGVIALAALPALAASNAMPSVSITEPAMGQAIGSDNIRVTASTANFTVECKDIGKPGVPGQGHIHAMLDGMTMAQMTNAYCSHTFTISGAGVKPGKHQLTVVLADDSHAMASKPAMVSFNYQPGAALSLPPGNANAKPAVRIVSPASGAAVNKKFDLQVAVTDFTLSCDAEGKADEPGVGHLHVFVKQAGVTDKAPAMSEQAGGSMSGSGMSGGEMSMVGMIGMPCTKTIPIDLSTWNAGIAKIVVILANNDHMPAMGTQAAAITVNLK
jgi:hypothetical protein